MYKKSPSDFKTTGTSWFSATFSIETCVELDIRNVSKINAKLNQNIFENIAIVVFVRKRRLKN